MPSPACVECQVEYEIETSGVGVVEMAWTPPAPYKLWSADLWRCPGCGKELLSGYGMQPIAEHFQKERMAQGLARFDRIIRIYERPQ